MRDIYFMDEVHKRNYHDLLQKFPEAESSPQCAADGEYQSACYIAAHPMMYHEYRDFLINEAKYPVDWIWYYLQASKSGKKVPFSLSSSMIQLGELSLNLWNDKYEFNLMRALTNFDENNIKILQCAMDIRLGHYRNNSIVMQPV